MVEKPTKIARTGYGCTVMPWPALTALIVLLSCGTSKARTDSTLHFEARLVAGYERTNLNYNLLLADTAAISPDSLDRLYKSADTRSEPLIGLAGEFSSRTLHLDNRLHYAASGWREQCAGQADFTVAPAWLLHADGRFDYHWTGEQEDTLLVDYWTLAGDVRLQHVISPASTASLRLDWDRLTYPGTRPSFGYNFDRLRSRVGWQWQTADFDFVEITAGGGKRFVPDSTDREYAEWFAEGYSDVSFAGEYRLLLAATVQTKDYYSDDPADDYTLLSFDGRGERGRYGAGRLSVTLRWDYWNFGAQDVVTYDFYELRPGIEYRFPLDETWSMRLGSEYGQSAAVDALYAQGDYQQPAAIVGVECMQTRWWADLRIELGRRNYAETTTGYTDFTVIRCDASADIELGRRLTLAAGANYERELHTESADNTDFFFFFINLYYRLLK
jgi:hypothetical protein